MLGVEHVYPHDSRRDRKDIVEYYLSKMGLVEALYKKATELSNAKAGKIKRFVSLHKLFRIKSYSKRGSSLTFHTHLFKGLYRPTYRSVTYTINLADLG